MTFAANDEISNMLMFDDDLDIQKNKDTPHKNKLKSKQKFHTKPNKRFTERASTFAKLAGSACWDAYSIFNEEDTYRLAEECYMHALHWRKNTSTTNARVPRIPIEDLILLTISILINDSTSKYAMGVFDIYHTTIDEQFERMLEVLDQVLTFEMQLLTEDEKNCVGFKQPFIDYALYIIDGCDFPVQVHQ